MDSDTPDIMALQELCHEYNATLMVDVAHDLGCLGEDGRGHIGMQNMLGKVDIVMGSFSKTFASNGGFVACPSRSVQQYLRYFSTPGTFSNALSPIQAAVALKAFEIVDSAEGRALRQSLMTNILALRDGLRDAGLEVYGDPSAIVAVKMGTEATARLVSRRTDRPWPHRQYGRISRRSQRRGAIPPAGDGGPHRPPDRSGRRLHESGLRNRRARTGGAFSTGSARDRVSGTRLARCGGSAASEYVIQSRLTCAPLSQRRVAIVAQSRKGDPLRGRLRRP